MRLCFGTFATVLNLCCSNISQTALIARIVNIIDPNSRYTGIDLTGDRPAIHRLLSCKINFVLSNGNSTEIPALEIIVEDFSNKIAPLIDADKKAYVIITLLKIIQNDKYINFNGKDNFEKYFAISKYQLLLQENFLFSDFLSKILLYTTCSNVENRVGETYVKTLTEDYINNLVKPYAYEYHWNETTQTLTLLFMKYFNIFNQAILDYQINVFIEEIDPSNYMNLKWIENGNAFIKNIINKLLIPYSSDSIELTSFMLIQIQKFIRTLDKYIEYVGYNMRPITESPDIFVPIHRDENIKWAMHFEKETKNYRQQLIDLYQNIYHHMLFAPD